MHRYVWLYNQQLPQSALGSKSPLQAMKDWYKLKPELFKKQPYNRPGCDSYQHSRRRYRMHIQPKEPNCHIPEDCTAVS